jgi:hypothetical protein
MLNLQGKCTSAPVAQRIEHWPPEPCAGVRVAPGVLLSKKLAVNPPGHCGKNGKPHRTRWGVSVFTGEFRTPLNATLCAIEG